ncbi:hypothetical protein SI65_02072 [Aspergillus cristatus]|uniref:Uncharacterized protein n=1 Tax=Aspergillus cristatus TaxID=573508 RepID=A0A1E3BU36_ASPCR|nr:hypothetical protein SI65_01807 [Aspergillus cristatus]ODM24482.1 hypothetical protein SI65_02072 [Aspergillus cristatus]
MMRPRDPRIRQTLNQISSNLESANETAQEGIYAFSQNYISPCFATIGNCVYACTAPCLPSREDQIRRRRRGRAEANFDFYDDWDNDIANDSLLGWGSDELDRLLAGSGLARGTVDQPRRQRKMSYGTRGTRRKSSVLVPENRNDPTVIPSSSFLGFLERFPWRLGARGQKYRPSAADLQEHPGGRRFDREEEPLLETGDRSEDPASYGNNVRDRSATQSSRETANSLSSRGDLIMSDEEEDAVPLDDEFALALGRRGTGLDSDDQSGRKSSVRRSTSGTVSSTTDASLNELRMKKKRGSRIQSPRVIAVDAQTPDAQSLDDLKREEEQAELKEEQEIIKKRFAAQRLASNRGLDQDKSASRPSLSARSTIVSSDAQHANAVYSPRGSISDRKLRDDRDNSQTEPFPSLPQTPVSSTGHESWPDMKASDDNPGSPNPGSDRATDG